MARLVKLGGSVLTEKGDTPTLREKALARLAGELATSPEPVVLVHGAGSFGHPGAAVAGLVEGIDDKAGAQAAAQVHADVRELNLAVLEALRDQGMAPATLSPFGQLGCSDGRPGAWNLVPVHRLLGLGFTPVTHGDVVLDTTRGVTIVSGDHLMVELARFLRPEVAVFVTDRPGVYSGPPEDEGAELLSEITPAQIDDLIAHAGPTKGPDVTGGMAGKLGATRAMLPYVGRVGVVSGLEPGRLERALAGEIQGTVAAQEEDAP